MTDCITAEEYKPENVEHMERDAGYKAPSLSLSLSLSLTVQLIAASENKKNVRRYMQQLRLMKYADISTGPSCHDLPPAIVCVCKAQRKNAFTLVSK